MEKKGYCRTGLPVDVWGLCARMGICILYDDHADGWEGVCFLKRKDPHILIKSGLSIERERYIVAHELGHLMSGHVGAWGTVKDRPDLPHYIQEREAIAFALELIMPQSVLQVMSQSATQIASLCGVTFSMALYRCTQFNRFHSSSGAAQ